MAAANARTSSLEARQAMGGDDPAMPTPTFEPVRRPSPAYGLPRGNLVAGGCRQGGRERARVSEQTRTARSGCAQRDARVSHLARLAAADLARALGALQQSVPSLKVYEVCF